MEGHADPDSLNW